MNGVSTEGQYRLTAVAWLCLACSLLLELQLRSELRCTSARNSASFVLITFCLAQSSAFSCSILRAAFCRSSTACWAALEVNDAYQPAWS